MAERCLLDITIHEDLLWTLHNIQLKTFLQLVNMLFRNILTKLETFIKSEQGVL